MNQNTYHIVCILIEMCVVLVLGSGHDGSIRLCSSSSSYTKRLGNHSKGSKSSDKLSFTACPAINSTTWYIAV